MAFKSLADLIEVCNQKNQDFKTVVLENDCKETGMTREDSIKQMTALFDAMLFAHANYNGKLRSTSGLAGGDGQKTRKLYEGGYSTMWPFLRKGN